jgi:hypothetical protein
MEELLDEAVHEVGISPGVGALEDRLGNVPEDLRRGRVNIPRQMVDLQRSEEFDILGIEVPSEVASKLFPDKLLNLFRGAVTRQTLRFPVQGGREPYLPHALGEETVLGKHVGQIFMLEEHVENQCAVERPLH